MENKQFERWPVLQVHQQVSHFASSSVTKQNTQQIPEHLVF